jgi:putative addiction module antidote
MICGSCCHIRDMLEAKLIKVGSEIGFILPEEALKRLRAKEGDTVLLTETQQGWMLTPDDEEFRRQMAIAEDIMRRYHNTLRELAK